MTEDDLQLLYEYDRWANNRVLQAASALSAEQFTRDLGGSFRSVRDTLVHIIGGEWIWCGSERGASGNWRPYRDRGFWPQRASWTRRFGNFSLLRVRRLPGPRRSVPSCWPLMPTNRPQCGGDGARNPESKAGLFSSRSLIKQRNQVFTTCRGKDSNRLSQPVIVSDRLIAIRNVKPACCRPGV
jgi:DinB family protein